MAEQRAKDRKALASQRRRLEKLERQRQKLIDAYLAEAIPVADLKQRQEALLAEQQEAERLIRLASINHEIAEQRLEVALGLLEHCERLYVGESDKVRRDLNQAFFDGLEMDKHGVVRAILAPPFAQLHDMSIGFAEEDEDDQDGPGYDPDGPGGPPGPRAKTTMALPRQNPTSKPGSGSNVALLAEGEGFEPSSDGTARNGFRDRRIRPLCHPSAVFEG